MTADFIDGSTATDLLTIVISTSEIFYHLIERGSDQLHIEGSIQGVVAGEHSISFFVVEESGIHFNRTASTPKVVSVTEYQLVQGRVKLEAVISRLLGRHHDCQVSVFVVGENGLPFSRVASTPKPIALSSAVVNAENSEC